MHHGEEIERKKEWKAEPEWNFSHRPDNEAGDKYSSSGAIILAIGLMTRLVKRHLMVGHLNPANSSKSFFSFFLFCETSCRKTSFSPCEISSWQITMYEKLVAENIFALGSEPRTLVGLELKNKDSASVALVTVDASKPIDRQFELSLKADFFLCDFDHTMKTKHRNNEKWFVALLLIQQHRVFQRSFLMLQRFIAITSMLSKWTMCRIRMNLRPEGPLGKSQPSRPNGYNRNISLFSVLYAKKRTSELTFASTI